MITSNKDNLDKLIEAVQGAQKEIMICSAWIRSETLSRLFNDKVKSKLKQGAVKLRVIVRLGEAVDVKITNPEVFNLVQELNGEIKYHRKLHAKLYAVDDNFAMLGSFNLTGGGFGNDQRPGGNPEAGVYFSDKVEVEKVKDQFEYLWEHEAKKIERSLVGFALNSTSHREFTMAGIKDLPLSKYLEIKVSKTEFLLCKIDSSEKHALYFYSHPDDIYDFEQKKEMFEAYANKEELAGQAKAVAISRDVNEQMNIAKVSIVAKLDVSDNKVTSSVNLLPPLVGAEVYEADADRLQKIYNRHGFSPANMLSNPEIPVGFNPKELVTKHMAVFGSTGSGKSYFTKKMLKEKMIPWYLNEFNGRIIVLDPHGEYARDFSKGGVFELPDDQFKIFGGEDSRLDISKRFIDSSEDIEQVLGLSIKKVEREWFDKKLKQAVSRGKSDIEIIEFIESENGGNVVFDYDEDFQPFFDAINNSKFQYLKNLSDIVTKEFEEDEVTGTFTYGSDKATDQKLEKSREIRNRLISRYENLTDRVKEKIEKSILQTNFYKHIEAYYEKSSNNLSIEVLSDIKYAVENGDITFQDLDLVSEMNDNKVYCIDMSKMHEEELRYELAAGIMTVVFNNKKQNNEETLNTFFVVEEAHNFAPEGRGKANPAAKILQKIAAEGRKFNIGILAITQRPAYVSKGVLAQCSTQAIFRLVNGGDISTIAETVEGISDEELKLLPRFKQGEGIFTGVAIDEPVLIKV
jgi:hypothetical protein